MIYANLRTEFFSTLKEFRKLNGIEASKETWTPAEKRNYYQVLSAMGRRESVSIVNFNRGICCVLMQVIKPAASPVVKYDIPKVPSYRTSENHTAIQGQDKRIIEKLDDLKYRAHLKGLGFSGLAIRHIVKYSVFTLPYWCNIASKMTDENRRPELFSFVAQGLGLTVAEVMA